MRCCLRFWIGRFGGSCERGAFGSRNTRKETKGAKGFRVFRALFASFAFQTALDDQYSIVAHLDDLQAQVDELTALQDTTQTELDRAFRGELQAG